MRGNQPTVTTGPVTTPAPAFAVGHQQPNLAAKHTRYFPIQDLPLVLQIVAGEGMSAATVYIRQHKDQFVVGGHPTQAGNFDVGVPLGETLLTAARLAKMTGQKFAASDKLKVCRTAEGIVVTCLSPRGSWVARLSSELSLAGLVAPGPASADISADLETKLIYRWKSGGPRVGANFHKGRYLPVSLIDYGAGSAAYNTVVGVIERAINILFTPANKSVAAYLDVDPTMSITTTVGNKYHVFGPVAVRDLLSSRRLAPLIQKCLLKADKDGLPLILRYLGTDLIHDAISVLGGKCALNVSAGPGLKEAKFIDWLAARFNLIYRHEKNDLAGNQAEHLARSFPYSKMAAEYMQPGSRVDAYGKRKVLAEKALSLFSPAPNDLSLDQHPYRAETAQQLLQEFSARIASLDPAVTKGKLLVCPTLLEQSSALDSYRYMFAAKDGIVCIIYASQTASKVAGEVRWAQMEVLVYADRIEKSGQAAPFRWYAKPKVSVLAELGEEANYHLNSLLEGGFREMSLMHMPPEVRDACAVQLGIAFDRFGQQVVVAPDGSYCVNPLNYIDDNRYNWRVVMADFVADWTQRGLTLKDLPTLSTPSVK